MYSKILSCLFLTIACLPSPSLQLSTSSLLALLSVSNSGNSYSTCEITNALVFGYSDNSALEAMALNNALNGGCDDEEPTSLCSELSLKRRRRALNSEKLSSDEVCEFGEIATISVGGSDIVTCSAVLASTEVAGETTTTFVTTTFCQEAIELFIDSPDISVDLNIGGESIEIDSSITTTDGEDGIVYLNVPPESVEGLTCAEPTCAYDASMSGEVDMSNCKIVSYGNYDENYGNDGLREVSLKENPNGCAGSSAGLCFESTSGDPVYCVGDASSPIYCYADSTDEWIMMGLAEFDNVCGDSSDVAVVPV